METVLNQLTSQFTHLVEYLKPETPLEYTAWGLIALGTVGLVAGVVMILDDIRDFGLSSYPGHWSPLHHWMWGLILALASLIPLAIGLALLIREKAKRFQGARA